MAPTETVERKVIIWFTIKDSHFDSADMHYDIQFSSVIFPEAVYQGIAQSLPPGTEIEAGGRTLVVTKAEVLCRLITETDWL